MLIFLRALVHHHFRVPPTFRFVLPLLCLMPIVPLYAWFIHFIRHDELLRTRCVLSFVSRAGPPPSFFSCLLNAAFKLLCVSCTCSSSLGLFSPRYKKKEEFFGPVIFFFDEWCACFAHYHPVVQSHVFKLASNKNASNRLPDCAIMREKSSV